MEVTLLGTGDTTGTPTVDCNCDTCQAARERDVERTRFSVHVRNERTGEGLLIDASPDFRQQFLREGLAAPNAAVITHVHFDHLHGLGNVFRLTRDLPVHAVGGEAGVADAVREQYHYLDALDVRDEQPFEPFEAAGFEVQLVPVDHPPLACFGVVVEDPETGAKLSLSGDTSYDVPGASRDALRDPDLLIVDGIVNHEFCDHHPAGGADHDAEGVPRTFGTKHMTFAGARALADDLDADRYRIVHVSHYPPADRVFQEDLAVDGEQFTL